MTATTEAGVGAWTILVDIGSFRLLFLVGQSALERLGKRRGANNERVTFAYYEAGHMMYLHHPSLVKYKKDLARFILESTAR